MMCRSSVGRWMMIIGGLLAADAVGITRTAEIEVPEEPHAMFTAGDYLYVASNDSGLRIYNVSDSSSPFAAGAFDSTERQEGFMDVAVTGDYAYCSREVGGLDIIDVSNPANPVRLDHVGDGGGTCIALSGNYAFVGNNDGVDVYDVGTVGESELVESYEVHADGSDYNYAEDIAIQGDYAYVAYEDSGLHIVSIQGAPAVAAIGIYREQDGMRLSGVAVSGNYAYVSTPDEGVKIIDVSTPSDPRLVSSYNKSMGGGDGWAVAAVGTMVYLLYQEWGVYLIDAAEPETPSYVAKYPTGIAFNGDYRYMAVSGTMIYIYNDEKNAVYVLDASEDAPVGYTATRPGHTSALFVDYFHKPAPLFYISNTYTNESTRSCALFSLEGRCIAAGTVAVHEGASLWNPDVVPSRGRYILRVTGSHEDERREVTVY